MTDINDPIAFAETFWNIELKRATRDEYVGPCPFCNDGKDRFHVWQESGNYWCRVCEEKGFLDNLDKSQRPTGNDLTERRLRRLEYKQKELERRMTVIERMSRCKDYVRYHNLLTDQHIAWWDSQGINQDSILEYHLGFCPRCPTDSDGRPSYTIPIINASKLLNIRHRLVQAPDGDKYRPHMAGLGTQLFNADFLHGANSTVVVEGAKKSIVLGQHGIPNVAVMGKRSFRREWLEWFADLEIVYIALDPDAIESGRRLAAMFDGRGRTVNLPVKPDDFFFKYGGTVSDFASYLALARPIGKLDKPTSKLQR